MGLLREEDINERKRVKDATWTAEHPLEAAIRGLIAIKDKLVSDIVDNARSRYVRTGELQAVLDLETKNDTSLVGSVKAANLIKEWVEEFDPEYTATVRIGPDCSGNYSYRPELVVEFERKVAN